MGTSRARWTGWARRPRRASSSWSAAVPSSTSMSSVWLARVKLSIVSARSSLPRLDRDEVVADPLDLAEQVARDHDRDAELLADPRDQLEHRVPARRVEAVGRLVEQQQPRVAREGLGELDPLLHAGGVGADLPVALLVQADVAQRLGGPLPGGGRREAGHAAHVRDELGRRDVRRQAVVLGHVADELPDLHRRPSDAVVAEHLRHALRGLKQAEEDLDQGRLARAVGADQAGDAGREGDGQARERGDAARVDLGQRGGLDDRAGAPRRRGMGSHGAQRARAPARPRPPRAVISRRSRAAPVSFAGYSLG